MVYQQPLVFRRLKRARGFTLVEILVVVAILSVLAAILLPVFLSIRERARQTTCASNLGQLYKATALYAGDNDGFRPMYQNGPTSVPINGQDVIFPDQSAELVQSLQPYARSTEIWFCPDDPLRGNTDVLKRHRRRATTQPRISIFIFILTAHPRPGSSYLQESAPARAS